MNTKIEDSSHSNDKANDIVDFDLPDVSADSAPVAPRVHRAPGDSTCISCEG